MSVDFAIFDPTEAPRDGKAFRLWFDGQVDWDISAPMPGPDVLTQDLRHFYDEMVLQFPDLSRGAVESEMAIDYLFSPHLIYCFMRWQKADDAWALVVALASRFNLGTYDPMSNDDRNNKCIVFPEGPLPNDPTWISKIFSRIKG